MTDSKIDGKMTDSKIKRILGAELKVGDVVVLTDDDGMDRYFTIREPLEAVLAVLVQGLQKEAFNPVARQLLESIGEDSAQSAQFAPWCEPPGF